MFDCTISSHSQHFRSIYRPSCVPFTVCLVLPWRHNRGWHLPRSLTLRFEQLLFSPVSIWQLRWENPSVCESYVGNTPNSKRHFPPFRNQNKSPNTKPVTSVVLEPCFSFAQCFHHLVELPASNFQSQYHYQWRGEAWPLHKPFCVCVRLGLFLGSFPRGH